MTRFRNWRRWVAAFVLLPATALMIGISVGSADGAEPEARTSSLAASSKAVHPHEKVTLRGRFRPIATAAAPVGDTPATEPASQSVRIQFRAFGAKYWHDARRTRSSRKGRFSERIPVKRSGRFRAISADGRTTRPKKIRVHSVTQGEGREARQGRPEGDRQGSRLPGGHEAQGHRQGRRSRSSAPAPTGPAISPPTGSPATPAPRRCGSGPPSNLIAAGSKAKAGKVSVFRPAVASYYGPGLYGGALACGGTLSPSTMGVAHKSLPCGTKLTIRYHGRQVKDQGHRPRPLRRRS